MVGPFLYAATNHIDKHLLERYFQKDGVAVLILYSSLLSLLALPFIVWMAPDVVGVSIGHIFILGGVALIGVVMLWAYLKALSGDEPTVVIVFYQLVPVLGLVFGYFILGEMITWWQLLAMTVIIFGAIVISFEMDEAYTLRLRKKTLGYMLLACTCWALETTVFKMVALEEDVWRSLFWQHAMLGIVGMGIFIFIPAYRRRFLSGFRNNSAAVLSLNLLNEGLYMTGNAAVAFASMLAPIALVLLMNAFQPFFVLLFGLILAILFPKIATEHADEKVLQKIIAIGITGAGTYMLVVS